MTLFLISIFFCLSFFFDWELFKKPKSVSIRKQIIKDILNVDPVKWKHPKLPEGKTNSFYGTVEKDENGKEFLKPADWDIYHYEHPDLDWRIADYPLGTCKEGEFKNVTKRDCDIIRNIFYKLKINEN